MLLSKISWCIDWSTEDNCYGSLSPKRACFGVIIRGASGRNTHSCNKAVCFSDLPVFQFFDKFLLVVLTRLFLESGVLKMCLESWESTIRRPNCFPSSKIMFLDILSWVRQLVILNYSEPCWTQYYQARSSASAPPLVLCTRALLWIHRYALFSCTSKNLMSCPRLYACVFFQVPSTERMEYLYICTQHQLWYTIQYVHPHSLYLFSLY